MIMPVWVAKPLPKPGRSLELLVSVPWDGYVQPPCHLKQQIGGGSSPVFMASRHIFSGAIANLKVNLFALSSIFEPKHISCKPA
jgi:hypothetical protein